MLLLLHVVVKAVALQLEPFAFGLALSTAQRIGVVPVGDRQDGEVAGAGDADLAGVDGRGQAREDQRGCSGGDDGGRRAFDLCTLAVHGDVVNGVADFLLVVFGGVKGKGDQGRQDEGEEGEWTHGIVGLGFHPMRSKRRAKIVELGVMRPAFLPLLALFSLAFSAESIPAQKIFSVDYESRADVKVFVVDYESRADLVVYKEDYESRADGNDGHWFFVKYESRADKTIFFVDYESRADLKVFFVDYESRAGWRNKSKQHLLY